MKDEIRFIGKWWLPDNPSDDVSGVLHFIPGNLPKLELNGVFIKIVDEYPFILGFTPDGKRITLYKCYKNKHDNSIPGYETTGYVANICLIGHHYTSEDEIYFKSINMTFLNLEEWLGFKIWKIERQEKKVKTHRTRTELPEEIKIKLDKYSLKINYSLSYSLGDYKEHIETITSWITIDFNQNVNLNDIWSIIQEVSNFISYCVGDRSPLLFLKANADYMDVHPHEVEFLYSIFQSKTDSRKPPMFMVTTFNQISDAFETYFNNWIKMINSYQPTYNLYFSTFKNPYTHPIDEFLSLVQSLESYHERKYPSEVLPEDNYQEVLRTTHDFIEKIVPDSYHKTHLINKTNYWNFKGLRKRLKEIYDENREIYDSFVNGRNNFIDRIVNTRNYYTHYDKKLETRIIPVKQLPTYTQQLKWIIDVIFLREIGFDDERVRIIFERIKQFSSFKTIF